MACDLSVQGRHFVFALLSTVDDEHQGITWILECRVRRGLGGYWVGSR